MVPLILTLRLDANAFEFFNQLRTLYFPPERNLLQAHLTLFHHLPDNPDLRAAVSAAAADVPQALDLCVTGLLKLGGGVAYKIESEALVALHRRLQVSWQAHLTRQDLQPLRPHVTVQNKVLPSEALLLYQQLSASFHPFAARGLGLDLFAYLGGPWRWEAFYPFHNTAHLAT